MVLKTLGHLLNKHLCSHFFLPFLLLSCTANWKVFHMYIDLAGAIFSLTLRIRVFHLTDYGFLSCKSFNPIVQKRQTLFESFFSSSYPISDGNFHWSSEENYLFFVNQFLKNLINFLLVFSLTFSIRKTNSLGIDWLIASCRQSKKLNCD